MKLKVGNYEATQLRSRIATLGLTQKQVADHLQVSERYIREILATTKTKPAGVDKNKMEDMLALLGISSEHVFQQKEIPPSVENPHLETYIKKLKGGMYKLLSKDTPEETHNQQLAHFLQEDKAVNKTMGFWYTLIVKTIADKYKVMRHFFEENDFFSIIPKTGYWRKFRHDASIHKNCYFSFKLVPKQRNSAFRIAYTLESPIHISPLIPRKIKIIFGKIEQFDDCTLVTQFHDTPGSFRVKPYHEIIVTLWLDEANHDFILMSEHDFELHTTGTDQSGTYSLGIKSKREVRDKFHALDTVLFPRNHIFHRAGRQDMGDDPIFFWSNQTFLEWNAELTTAMLEDT